MKIITFQDIVSLQIPPSRCFDWAAAMIQNKKKAILPPKISLKPFDGVFCNVMPCMIFGLAEANMGGGKGCYTVS